MSNINYNDVATYLHKGLHHYDNVASLLKIKANSKDGISFLYNGKPCFTSTVSNELYDKRGKRFFKFNINGKEFTTDDNGYDMIKNLIHNYIYTHFSPKQLVA